MARFWFIIKEIAARLENCIYRLPSAGAMSITRKYFSLLIILKNLEQELHLKNHLRWSWTAIAAKVEHICFVINFDTLLIFLKLQFLLQLNVPWQRKQSKPCGFLFQLKLRRQPTTIIFSIFSFRSHVGFLIFTFQYD